jgi:ATP-dependent Clp protease ATP-binding subunit ClpC
LELAVEEAGRLGHHYIGREPLLLGLVREGEEIAAGVLESLGATMKRVRRETLRALSGQGALRSRMAELVTRLTATVDQICRLRQEAQTMAQEHVTDDTAPPAPTGA